MSLQSKDQAYLVAIKVHVVRPVHLRDRYGEAIRAVHQRLRSLLATKAFRVGRPVVANLTCLRTNTLT